jgi:hypothetical protein
MKATPLQKPLHGERLLATEPPLKPELRSWWHRRLNLFTGRSLTAIALENEQEGRAGRLALIGQAFPPGVGAGLEVLLERSAQVGQTPRDVLHMSAGIGVTSSGEDVVIPTRDRIDVMNVSVFLPAVSGLTAVTPASGTARGRAGATLRELIHAGQSLSRAGVLILAPIRGETIGRAGPTQCDIVDNLSDEIDPETGLPQLTDPCERDVRNDAFEDWQQVDAARLMFYPWPMESLALPDPASPQQWRNQLAYAIFAAEAALPYGEVLPWEEIGLPVALIGFDDKWQVQFLDRHAVVRSARLSRRPTVLAAAAGTPTLWDARVRQFAEHVADAVGALKAGELVAQQFRFFPPVGLLPKDAISARAGLNHFFPPTLQVDASPIPIEQIDAAIQATASLAPIDPNHWDVVRVLVPVPQAWYEPRLLFVEPIDPEFVEKLDQFIDRRAFVLQQRENVRGKRQVLAEAISGEPLTFPGVDPAALEPAESRVTTGKVDEQAFGTEKRTIAGKDVDVAVKYVDFRDELLDVARRPFELMPDEQNTLKKGLKPFIELLEIKIKHANDKIDLGFGRVHTDTYRLRQLMLGNVAGTRLATSPALAQIAMQSDTAVATKEQINDFFAKAKLEKIEPRIPVIDAGGRAAAGRGGPAAVFAGMDAPAAEAHSARATRARAGERASARETRGRAEEVFERVRESGVPQEIAEETKRGAPELFGVAETFTMLQADVIEQAPIIGKALDFRTMTVAERIGNPKAPEARDFAVSTKYDVLKSLASLTDVEWINPEGRKVPVEGISLDGLMVPGFYVKPAAPGQRGKFELRPLKDITGALGTAVLKGDHDPDPEDSDEAGFFGVAVRAADHVIAALRIFEGRVQTYRTIVERARKIREELQAFSAQANARLTQINTSLMEARHDVAVARALLADEIRRVTRINARREAIIRDHVPFLAYHRPRVVNGVQDAPARPLNPGLTESPVPACLRSGAEAPPELRAMVNLIRDAPVRWLINMRRLLDRLDRLDVLRATIEHATIRASFAARDINLELLQQGPFGSALAGVLAAQQQVIAAQRILTAQFDMAQLFRESWMRARDRAEAIVSLGDLMDASHGRTDVAQQAGRELDSITRVAACLYVAFGDVTPLLRLQWAERLSQYDAPVNLRNLASLPGWEEIEYLQRQEMQILTDWLYGRVDAAQPEAVGLISDLVRVAALLASHAPVSSIVTGHVAENSRVKEGGRIELIADVARVHVGMHVFMYSGEQVVARGVVEDLGGGRASARVTSISADAAQGGSVTLGQDATVHFGEPSPHPNLPGVAPW